MSLYLSGTSLYLSGMVTGIIVGFVTGIIFPYIINIYRKYMKHGDIKKTIFRETMLTCSSYFFDSFFDCFYDSILKKNTKNTEDIVNLLDILTQIIDIVSTHNKSFEIVFRDGCPQIKILNGKLYSDPKFINIVSFLRQNNINLGLPVENSRNITELD